MFTLLYEMLGYLLLYTIAHIITGTEVISTKRICLPALLHLHSIYAHGVYAGIT